MSKSLLLVLLLCLLSVNAKLYTCECVYALKKVDVGDNLFVWAEGETYAHNYTNSDCKCQPVCENRKPPNFKYVEKAECHVIYENPVERIFDTIFGIMYLVLMLMVAGAGGV